MMQMHKILASWLGIGYIGRGGGTVAAMFAALSWYFIISSTKGGLLLQVSLVLLTIIVGIWSSNNVECHWGKDDQKVVIDEVAGMFVSVIGLPLNIYTLLLAFTLFRFFDIAKPLYIKNIERLPGGFGVMADDVLAGIYTNLVTWSVVFLYLSYS